MRKRHCNIEIFGNDLIGRRSAAAKIVRRDRRRVVAAALGGIAVVATTTLPAQAQTAVIVPPPFVATLSNTTPLVFGMDEVAAAQALGAPLNYVGGRPGDETFLVIRTIGGGGFFPRRDRLYLQFRHSRLTGWKGDWGRNWMWR